MIQFENVTRLYGRKVAVENLDLTVPQGEVFAFLGPNGAGKTTTVRMLVGLLRPTAGKVTVCGHDTFRRAREATRSLGYVPDEAFLYDKLSGREFLEFVGRMRGLDRTQVAQSIVRQADQFTLGEFLDDLTESYSHGMKQRLVLAAVLLNEPSLLVVDEPMVGLDPKNVRLVKDLFRRRTARGETVFMSTHALTVAEEVADRIGIIDRGRLNFLGTLADLRGEMSAERSSLEHLFLELTGTGDGRGAEPPAFGIDIAK